MQLEAALNFDVPHTEPLSSHIRYSNFAQHLVARNKVTAQPLARAEHIASESGERLGNVLTRLGLITERDLADEFATYLKLPLATPADYPSSPLLENQLSQPFLRHARLIPLVERGDAINIAMIDPLDGYSIDAVRFAVGKTVLVSVAYPTDLEAALDRLYGGDKAEIRQIAGETHNSENDGIKDDVDKLRDIASDAPVIRLVNTFITRAVEAGASDIHIEPIENELRVRYRIDGVLQETDRPPAQLAAAVISRIKIMAKLNIAERRLAQDGRIGLAVRGKDVDLRVATTPTIRGESAVLRILDRGTLALDFAALGFEETLAQKFRQFLAKPHGIVLVTGPTGSGKTTTLYTALHELNAPSKKILTIEDPVEYQLSGINQVQVKPLIGLTFANALRAFLRHDPDIMMIGEIRDLETAEVSVQAALTGHLILSTLHTNDASSAITRLFDMGVENYLLTSTINGIAAQRLVRTLCPHCKEAFTPEPEIVARWSLTETLANGAVTLYRPVGCDRCNRTGYRGRTTILELLSVSDDIRKAILKSADARTIEMIAVQEGMQTMLAHGLAKCLNGITTLSEVLRVTRNT